jgi:hypothetical protein
MSRPPFTLFAQHYFSALLHDFGTVYLNEPVPRNPDLRVFKLPSRTDWGTEMLSALTEGNDRVMISPEVIGEAELVDVLFEPDDQKTREWLGLLGELLSVPCIIESFRWLPTTRALRTCMGHWLQWKVEASGGMIPVDGTPREYNAVNDDEDIDDKILLIIVPSMTARQLQAWGAKPSPRKIPGVYESPPAFCTTIVVTGELPQTLSTLWLRLLSRGNTQRSAIRELIQLEANHPLRAVALRQLQQWYQLIAQGQMGKETAALTQLLSQIEI